MIKKALIAVSIAIFAVFTVSTAANAAGYTADGPSVTVTVGDGPVALSFTGFTPNEPTTASAPDAVTLATVKVVSTASKAADASGAVTYTATATQPGTYTVTVTGQSGAVGVATLTVAPADLGSANGGGEGSNGGLPNTGYETPMLIIWGASGALILGIALVVVLGIVRKQRASA
jgi:hypothetical protein